MLHLGVLLHLTHVPFIHHSDSAHRATRTQLRQRNHLIDLLHHIHGTRQRLGCSSRVILMLTLGAGGRSQHALGFIPRWGFFQRKRRRGDLCRIRRSAWRWLGTTTKRQQSCGIPKSSIQRDPTMKINIPTKENLLAIPMLESESPTERRYALRSAPRTLQKMEEEKPTARGQLDE